MAAPHVSIAILHWGDPEVTAACLESLRRVTFPHVEVLVLDNGTPDRGGESLQERFPEFAHLRSDENLGFAAGNNLLIRRALEGDAQHVLLLNNDTEVEPGFLEPMITAAEADADVGLINPKILYADPPGTIWFSRGEHSLWTGLPRFVDRHRRDSPDDNATVEMTFATGCALLMPRRTMETIGLLDDGLFMYAEDLDISIRARWQGLKILNVRSSRIVHHEEVQRRKSVPDPFRLRLTTRNLLTVNWRHGRPWHRLTFLPWFTVRWLGHLTVKNLLLGFPGDVAAIWRGVADALRGESGPPREKR